MGLAELSSLYNRVREAWLEAFRLKTSEDVSLPDVREKIASLLKATHKAETRAVEIMCVI